jgi:hypothetical protein
MARVRQAGRRGVREEPAFDTPLMRRQLESGGCGLEAARTRLSDQAGNSLGGGHVLPGRLRGRTAAYPQRCRRGTVGLLLRRANLSEHGNRSGPCLACPRPAGGWGWAHRPPTGPGRGGAAVVLRAGESPRTRGRAAAVSRREGYCNAGRRVAERRCSWAGACRAMVEGIGDAGQASPMGGGRSWPPVR